jgi:hypothetical protein
MASGQLAGEYLQICRPRVCREPGIKRRGANSCPAAAEHQPEEQNSASGRLHHVNLVRRGGAGHAGICSRQVSVDHGRDHRGLGLRADHAGGGFVR